VCGPDHTPADGDRRILSAGAQPGEEQGDRNEDAQGPVVRARGGGAGSKESGSRQAEDRHRVGQSDSLLRVPAVYDGERSSDRAESERCAQGDGRRSRSVHRGVPQALRQSGGGGVMAETERSFVEAARRDKLKELVERGIAPFAYRFERSATA